MLVLWDVKLHELVESPESVTERGVLNSFFIGYNEVVKGFQTRDGINDKMPITWNRADWVGEESDVHHRRQRC